MCRFLAAVVLALSPMALIAADWPQWLGPKRDGSSSEIVEPWKQPPKELWRAKVGPGFSTPVVAGGRVFIHARVKGKEREELLALDDKSGKELWRTGYDRAEYSSVLNTGPQATPAAVGTRVYTYGITGVLSCFEADSGKIRWQVDAIEKLNAEVPRFGVCCSPLVAGNRVIVSVGGKGSSVVAFDAETGEIAWQALDEPASTSSPVLFTTAAKVGELTDVVFTTSQRVIGLSPLNGSVSWEFPLPFQTSGTSATPLVVGDTIVTSTITNGTTAIRLNDKLAAEKVWQKKDLSGYFSSGAVGKDRVYLVANTLKPEARADLACVDLATGKMLWKKEGLGYYHFGIIRTGDGKLLLLDDSGNLKLIDGAGAEYRELASAKVCGGTLVTPAFANGLVYARDDAGVVCIRLNP